MGLDLWIGDQNLFWGQKNEDGNVCEVRSGVRSINMSAHIPDGDRIMRCFYFNNAEGESKSAFYLDTPFWPASYPA